MIPDESHDLLVQVLDAGERAAGDEVALDAREPVLDPIPPRRTGARAMDPRAGVGLQKRTHALDPMAANVVADNVDLAPGWLRDLDLFEEGHGQLTVVGGRGFANHLPGARIERGQQAQRAVAQRAVALELEAVTLGVDANGADLAQLRSELAGAPVRGVVARSAPHRVVEHAGLKPL